MQVQGCAAVNKDQRAKDDGESMVANTPKCRRQKWSRIENEKLDRQSRQPKERDHRTDRAGEGKSRGEFIRSKKCQSAKRNDHEHDEAAVDPEEPAEKRMKRSKVRAPFQNPRREGTRDQDYEVQDAADDQPRFHSAPIVCINGRIT